ncbi:alpha,alpha-trehalose-phosphate synthase [UDP-forming] 1-like [Silene latifolia]|uniref:alpha,alpha-trehalose-phosphate synthase [UDP-forming] 1-like n=1 Tax=Silene latifolia TaxID=37657 RepID=UPI003D785A10
MGGNKRLIVVANRLPITAVRSGKESWTLQRNSAGGLVTALSGIKDQFEMRWVGWTGVSVPDKKGQKSLSKALEPEGCIPVFLDDDTVDGYYNGYSNNILWPLFHHFSLPQPHNLKTARLIISQFTTYKKANEMFARVVLKNYKEGDIVWIHDYHLMLLPKFLKTENNRMVIGWFLHTAFPSFQCYRALPSRKELLEAVVAADLIGFHIDDYVNNFVETCTKLIGLERVPQGLQDVKGKLTRVILSPIGIEPQVFFQELATPQIPKIIKMLKKESKGRKIILGVDRLDPIKGIPHKLLGFQEFMETNRDWWDKILFFQLLVPSRTDVSLYQELEIEINTIFGKMCSDFSTMFTRHPILVKHKSLPFDELCALLSYAGKYNNS